MRGYVYVISNKGKPNLVKVGYSNKDPKYRASEFDGTHDPHPHSVDYDALVESAYSLEQRVHQELKRLNLLYIILWYLFMGSVFSLKGEENVVKLLA